MWIELKDIARFDKHVNIDNFDNCWEWTAYKDDFGYGKFQYKDKKYRAHRFSWMINYGAIMDNLLVLHKCDNPKCVKPEHLFLGTYLDNAQDRVKKGRQAKGESMGRSKLTIGEVLDIRNKHATLHYTKATLAEEYNVSSQQIFYIINYKSWYHLL